MSLIITSSNSDSLDQSSLGSGIMQPQNYINSFQSPLYIKPNSEIGVVSLKCNRTGFVVPLGCWFGVYWGVQPGSDLDTADPNYTMPGVLDTNSSLTPDGTADESLPENRPLLTQSCSPNLPMLVWIEKGTYTQEAFAQQLERKIEDVAKRTYEHVSGVAVTIQVSEQDDDDAADDLFKGRCIRFTQSGDNGSTSSDAQMNWTPYIDQDTMNCQAFRGVPIPYETDDNVIPYSYGKEYWTDNFSVTVGAGESLITKGNHSGGGIIGEGKGCEAIGWGNPLGLSDGIAVFNISGAIGGDGGFVVGLTRNLVTNARVDYKAAGNPTPKRHQFKKKDVPFGFDADEGDASTYKPFYREYGVASDDLKHGTGPTFYDYGVAYLEDEFFVFQSDARDSSGQYTSVNKLVTSFTPTNASLQAGFYDAIRFDVRNERVTCSIRQSGKTVYDDLIAAATTTNGAKFKPVGMTNNLLFPKLYIEYEANAISLITWTGGTNGSTVEGQPQSYWDPRYYGRDIDAYANSHFPEFSVGDQDTSFLNEILVGGLVDRVIDQSRMMQVKTGTPVDKTFHTPCLLNASDGLAYEWAILTRENSAFGLGGRRGVGSYFTKMNSVNIRQLMGMDFGTYRENAVLAANTNVNVQMPKYTDGDGKDPTKPASQTLTKVNDIVMYSQKRPNPIGANQLFVRVSSLAHNSFNGNKGSISKILYGIPRWDARGNESGGLYYEPHERVYVDLNYNEKDLVLNDLNIQIVDINEQEATDLTGNTVCLLHIREKGSGSKGQNLLISG